MNTMAQTKNVYARRDCDHARPRHGTRKHEHATARQRTTTHDDARPKKRAKAQHQAQNQARHAATAPAELEISCYTQTSKSAETSTLPMAWCGMRFKPLWTEHSGRVALGPQPRARARACAFECASCKEREMEQECGRDRTQNRFKNVMLHPDIPLSRVIHSMALRTMWLEPLWTERWYRTVAGHAAPIVVILD